MWNPYSDRWMPSFTNGSVTPYSSSGVSKNAQTWRWPPIVLPAKWIVFSAVAPIRPPCSRPPRGIWGARTRRAPPARGEPAHQGHSWAPPTGVNALFHVRRVLANGVPRLALTRISPAIARPHSLADIPLGPSRISKLVLYEPPLQDRIDLLSLIGSRR